MEKEKSSNLSTESRLNVGLAVRPDGDPPDIEKPWWCPECAEWIHCANVTYYEIHDERYGGCGHICE